MTRNLPGYQRALIILAGTLAMLTKSIVLKLIAPLKSVTL